MQALLFADLTRKTLSDRAGGGLFSWPKLIQGDDVRIGLRFTERVDDQSVETTRTVSNLRATLGRDDARPESGTFRLKVGAGSPVVGTNVTALLDFDATAEEVAAAINALTGLTNSEKDVTCELVDGSWRVTLEDGTEKAFALAENNLFPVSFLRSRTMQVDGDTVHDLRLTQSPVAFVDAFAPVVPLPPTITALRDGGSETNVEWNEVQKLTVPPSFRGTYQITRSGMKTPLLSVDDGAEEIAAALASIADDDGEFLVTNPTGNAAHIEFSGSMGGINHDLLTVQVYDAPAGDPTFTLSLDTSELAVFLNKHATTVEKLILEIELELENEHDSEVLELVSFRSEVEVLREIGWESLNSAQNIDWLRPPLPKDYVPFVADQVNTGVLHYQTTLGNGVDTVFTVDHELGSESVAVMLRENSTPGDVLRLGTDYTLVIEDDQSVTVTLLGGYASPVPSAAALAITVMAMGEASAFDPHTHTIAQIVDLQDTLDTMAARVTTLETLVGVSGTVTSDDGTTPATIAEWTLPAISEVYPIRKLSDELAKVESIADITAAMLPRAGGLLPAIHDAVLEALPADLDDGVEGHLYQNQSGATVMLPGGMGRKTVKLLDDEFATVLLEDGRSSWYRIAPVAVGETSYFPTDFDRELFRLAINEKQLRLSKKLTVQFSIEVALLKANTNAQWLLRIEHAAASEDSTPEGTGITVTANATTNELSATAHGLADGAAGKFTTTTTLPAPLVAGTKYFVRDAAANTFKVSTTLGGAAVDLTDTGTGTHTVKAQTRANLAALTWNPVPILEQRIDLTSVAGIHEFGCTVTRSAGGVISATALLYKGTQAALSVPSSANFFLRARLCGFDTENNEADPRGFVGLIGLARVAGEEENTALGKAVIGSA